MLNIMNHHLVAKINIHKLMYKLTVAFVDGAVISFSRGSFFLITPGETIRCSTHAFTARFVSSGGFFCLGLLVSVALVVCTSISST